MQKSHKYKLKCDSYLVVVVLMVDYSELKSRDVVISHVNSSPLRVDTSLTSFFNLNSSLKRI